MSGVEAVGSVVAICTFAYPAVQDLYRKWKSKRLERNRKENENLQRLIGSSGDVIFQAYNEAFQRLGPSFARGDDRSRTILRRQRKIIDQNIKNLIIAGAGYKDEAFEHVIHPNHDPIARLCAEVVDATSKALVEQFRRQSQAAPIRLAPTVLPASYDRSSLREANAVYNCFNLPVKHADKARLYRRCGTCGWTSNRIRPEDVCSGGMFPRTLDNLTLDWDCLRQKFHHVEASETDQMFKYRCFVCKAGRIMSIQSLVDHIRRKHTWLEICDGKCVESSTRCGQIWKITSRR